jgi:hypothetical protein
MQVRDRLIFGLTWLCVALLTIPIEVVAGWSMTSPASESTRDNAAIGMGNAGDAGKFTFGRYDDPANPTMLMIENEIGFVVPGMIPGMASNWSVTLPPPQGGTWVPSPPSQSTPGTFIPDHYAWLFNNVNQLADWTSHHIVTP